MFRIDFVHSASQPILPNRAQGVHPFYLDSYARLSAVDRERIIVAEQAPPEQKEFLLEVLAPCAKECTASGTAIPWFFDIRTTEEYARVAPEYHLLEQLGLLHTRPLCIKGMQSLAFLQFLQIAEVSLGKEEGALVCCSELYSYLDPEEVRARGRNACAFFLSWAAAAEQKGLLLTSWKMDQDREGIEAVAEVFDGTLLYTEAADMGHLSKADEVVEGRQGMIEPIRIALDNLKKQDAVSILVVMEYEGRYGFYRLDGRRRSLR